MRTFNDEQGRSWTAERIGRTSGIVNVQGGRGSLPEPADIIRFACQSDSDEPQRETTIKAGLLANSSDAELLSRLETARQIRRR
jgi:hypothetical protein